MPIIKKTEADNSNADNDQALTENSGISDIPSWQLHLGKEELQLIADDTAGLIPWAEAKKLFEA
ncbi:hypothetical protein GCM10023093_09330 [Nemorincola caseinilytica]|uniref:Uncharacterized protein n=1 Tax=Nemorincola caseinilytica TaxID=2054315 RepID=A0ABP8NBH4_9BACT